MFHSFLYDSSLIKSLYWGEHFLPPPYNRVTKENINKNLDIANIAKSKQMLQCSSAAGNILSFLG